MPHNYSSRIRPTNTSTKTRTNILKRKAFYAHFCERFEKVLSAVDGNFVLRCRLRLSELQNDLRGFQSVLSVAHWVSGPGAITRNSPINRASNWTVPRGLFMWMFYPPLKTALVRERLQKAAPRTPEGRYATKSNDSSIDYKGIGPLDLSDLLCDPEDNLKDGPAEAQTGRHVF